MRLIRIGEQRSRVADDIRAGLTALGRGDGVVGGIALVDLVPMGADEPIDAVVVLPHGVLIVAGVDLPGPAMRLEAPLSGQWKADGWPLVGTGTAINPATDALVTANKLARHLHAATHGALRIGVALAVGPYVDSVSIPDVGPDSGVRVLYPTPIQLRDAIAALIPSGGQPFTVEQGRAILRAINPETPIQPDAMLRNEGFLIGGTASSPYPQPAEVTTKLPAIPVVPALNGARPSPPVATEHAVATRPARSKTPRARWFPFAAVALLIVGLIAAIGAAASGADTADRARAEQRARQAINGVQYVEVAAKRDQHCVRNTYGDVQASLERVHCAGMVIGSYLAKLDGRRAAVSIALIQFGERSDAGKLKKLADTPGTGGPIDLATNTRMWPDTTPSFDNATYRSTLDGAAVRLVRTVWLDEPTQPHDKLLTRIAATAFEVRFDG